MSPCAPREGYEPAVVALIVDARQVPRPPLDEATKDAIGDGAGPRPPEGGGLRTAVSSTPLRAAMYARISKEEQARGAGLSRPRSRCEMLALPSRPTVGPSPHRPSSIRESRARSSPSARGCRRSISSRTLARLTLSFVRHGCLLDATQRGRLTRSSNWHNVGQRTPIKRDPQKYIELGGTGFINHAADGHAAVSERKTNNTQTSRRALRGCGAVITVVSGLWGVRVPQRACGEAARPTETATNRAGSSSTRRKPLRRCGRVPDVCPLVGLLPGHGGGPEPCRRTLNPRARHGASRASARCSRGRTTGISSFTARTARLRSLRVLVSMRLQAKCSA